MEPVKIDWKNLDSVFVKEDLYENINAPKWIDFSAPEDSVDEDAWFCRPDCKHPKTVEDFFKLTPTSLKRPGSGKVNEVLPLGDRNKREANLKRRGLAQPQSSVSSKIDSKFNEDSENQNPNFSSTPPNQQAKSLKTMIKSSAEKNNPSDNDSTNVVQNDKTPKLRGTLSARNLFAGRDIFNHITEFVNEFKKMATRAKERQNVENSGDMDGREKEKKPLLEEPLMKSNSREKTRIKKRAIEAENFPKPLDLKIIKHKEEFSLMQIRTNPPSPQCFSATSGSTKPTPTKGSKSRLMDKENHGDAEQSIDKEVKNEELVNKLNNGRNVPILSEREARNIDMFWFLKPCTLSS